MPITIEQLESVNPGCDYYPDGYDEAAWRKFRGDVSDFRERLSVEFSLDFSLSGDSSIQDSTHGAEIGFPGILVVGEGQVVPCIRVSNHSRLYVITVARRITPETESSVETVAARLGFHYTPESMFGLPFDQRDRFNGDLFNQLYDYV
jgi:hypothetical protein